MSVVISKGSAICRDPNNCSPSKQLFSFPKSKRFDSDYVPPINQQVSYNIKRDFFKRQYSIKGQTSFGVDRPDLFYSKERLSKPTSVHYNIPSVF